VPVPNLPEASDEGGSGVATPQDKTHKIITGTDGKEEKLDSRELSIQFTFCNAYQKQGSEFISLSTSNQGR
jgi:hypothetical protein